MAAEHIEAQYIKCIYVQQVFLYGDSLKAELVAVVVPDPDALAKWAKDNNHAGDIKVRATRASCFLFLSCFLQQLCNTPAVRDFILAEMNKTGKEQKLKGFEFAKAIYLESEPFSPENDLLTPTFKPKRPQLKNRYEPQISALYKELDAKPKPAEK